MLIAPMLALVACGQSFDRKLEARTGCSGSQTQIGACLSERFVGADPRVLDEALVGAGFARASRDVYVYAGTYSYGISVTVHQRAGKVSLVSAV